MWKAFDELQELGLIGPERPRMFSVQVEGCAPIVRAFNEGQRFATPWENATTAASGLRVPAAIGDFLMLDCLRASKGAAISVAERELRPTQMRLSSAGLGYASLETAAAVAALPQLLEQHRIDRNDRVVVFDTGAGFKSESPSDLSLPVPVANDPGRWDEIIAKRRSH
jgi:threonine synthase